jgi:hypothetical protein
MLPEYDFSNGVRGKHYEAYQAAVAAQAIAPVRKSPDGI